MPFYRYSVARVSGGSCRFVQEAGISLAGNHAIQTLATPRIRGRRTNAAWHVGESELVAAIPKGVPGTHAILIDLKPSDNRQVSLYRIRDIWGYSQEHWTPLMLRLDALLVDFRPRGSRAARDVDRFKRQFDWAPNLGEGVVFEFLYVNGGTQGGDWNWGTVGRANGALLWRRAFEYFVNEAFSARGGRPAIARTLLRPRGC